MKNYFENFKRILRVGFFNALAYIANIERCPSFILGLLGVFSRKNCCYPLLDALAVHRKTPIKILEKLAEHNDNWVRKRVAGNRSSPLALLARLAHDDDFDYPTVYKNPHVDACHSVRRAVANNIKTSKDILESMINDKEPYIRGVVINRLKEFS